MSPKFSACWFLRKHKKRKYQESHRDTEKLRFIAIVLVFALLLIKSKSWKVLNWCGIIKSDLQYISKSLKLRRKFIQDIENNWLAFLNGIFKGVFNLTTRFNLSTHSSHFTYKNGS